MSKITRTHYPLRYIASLNAPSVSAQQDGFVMVRLTPEQVHDIATRAGYVKVKKK